MTWRAALPGLCRPSWRRMRPCARGDDPLNDLTLRVVHPLKDTATVPRIGEISMIELRVKEVRVKRGWTQERLARALGMKQAAVSRLERRARVRRLDVALIERIARVLKVSLRELVQIE